MTASGRGIFRSAVFGFAITATFVSYQLLTDVQSPLSRSRALMLSFLVLCPPSILSIAIRAPEVATNGFYILWGSIGALNAALYATIRFLFSRRLQRSD
jgi:hypothetical protein